MILPLRNVVQRSCFLMMIVWCTGCTDEHPGANPSANQANDAGGPNGGSGGQGFGGHAAAGADASGGAGGTGPVTAANDHSPLGVNVTASSYWSGNWPFVDAMHQADRFFSGEPGGQWSDGRLLDLDEHGWVRSLQANQVARKFVLASEQGQFAYPLAAGQYTVLWQGLGTIEFHGQSAIVEQSLGRAVLDIESDGLLYLEITSVNPSDYLRDIRVIMPGGRCSADTFHFCEQDADCDAGQSCTLFVDDYLQKPWHPVFLSELSRFKVLRFMDMMQTNREVWSQDGVDEPWPFVSWSDYPQPDDATWQPVPVSVLVDLANELNADPWLCVPHTADDDFVTQMATVVRDQLNPELKVYLEYSNEVWNDIFDQHHWVNRQGCLAHSSDPAGQCQRPGDAELCAPGSWDSYAEACMGYGQLFHAQRTAEIMIRWETVFGADYPARLVRVLGGQTGAAEWRGDIQLHHLFNGSEPTYAHVDAFGVAPYFGGGWDVANVDEAFATNDAEVWGTPVGTYTVLSGRPSDPWGGPLAWVQADVDYFAAHPELSHIRLIAYEGGQHFHSFDSTMHDRFVDINRDPRIYDVFQQYLALWTAATGGAMYVHYKSPAAWSVFGLWGSKEYQGQPLATAHKHRALVDFITAAQSTAP